MGRQLRTVVAIKTVTAVSFVFPGLHNKTRAIDVCQPLGTIFASSERTNVLCRRKVDVSTSSFHSYGDRNLSTTTHTVLFQNLFLAKPFIIFIAYDA